MEDHTLELGDFEGTIAEGEYGAGQIEIWDRGHYEIGQWLEDTVQFTLHGQRYRGQFRLIRFPRGGANAWLLVKSADLP